MDNFEKLLQFSLINIDKPAGPTSFSVSEYLKRQLRLKKTSHMGTLDPKVSGVLPITLGRSCKLANYFIKHDKTYVGVLETHSLQKLEELQDLIDKNFTGKIRQTPPNRSAVKREERERTVYYWKLTEASEDGKSFLFETKVEGGTYIRKLCSDLGEMIGGAHMGELRRTEAGIFDESTLVTLYDLDKAIEAWKGGDSSILEKMLMPAEEAIKKVLSFVEIDKSALRGLYTGKPLLKKNILKRDKLKKGESFAAFCGDIFVGVYKVTDENTIYGRSEFVYN